MVLKMPGVLYESVKNAANRLQSADGYYEPPIFCQNIATTAFEQKVLDFRGMKTPPVNH